MKNKGILFTVLNVLLTILLVFSVTGTFVLCFAGSVSASPDYLISQLEKNGTFNSVYSDLLKKYNEMSAQTSIPAEVYSAAAPEEWVNAAVREQAAFTYRQLSDDSASNQTDYSAFDEKITGYFENYASENHVIKDETYDQRLASSVENAKAVTASVIDVYHTETIKKTSLWGKLKKICPVIPSLRTYALIADAVILILLVVLRNPVYWTGTALFSSGMLTALPCVYVLASGMIMKFSIKDYTVFTLITGTMKSVVSTFMTIGIISLAAGILMIAVSVISEKKKA